MATTITIVSRYLKAAAAVSSNLFQHKLILSPAILLLSQLDNDWKIFCFLNSAVRIAKRWKGKLKLNNTIEVVHTIGGTFCLFYACTFLHFCILALSKNCKCTFLSCQKSLLTKSYKNLDLDGFQAEESHLILSKTFSRTYLICWCVISLYGCNTNIL